MTSASLTYSSELSELDGGGVLVGMGRNDSRHE